MIKQTVAHQCISFLLAVILCAACQPFIYEPKVSKINPHGPWLQGRQVHTDTLDGLVCMLQYDGADDESLAFTIGFANAGQKEVLIDPALFSSKATSFWPIIKDSAKYSMVKPVIDPEKMLVRLQSKIDDQKEEINTANAFSGVGIFMDLLLVSTGKANPAVGGIYAQNATRNAIEELGRKNKLEKSKTQKVNLQNLLLRKTTLFPGQSVGGLVYFHRHNKCKSFVLKLPVASAEFEFDYAHVLTAKRK